MGFLNPDLPDSLTSSVGTDWSTESAKALLSYLSVVSGHADETERLLVVLPTPCHPDELHALALVCDAGVCSTVVLLELRKAKSWNVFEKKGSATGAYLTEIGFSDCGWLEWDDPDKADSKLGQAIEDTYLDRPGFIEVCYRDEEGSTESAPLISQNRSPHRCYSSLEEAYPEIQTVFGQFMENLKKTVHPESIFWVPNDIQDIDEFRRQLAVFRQVQQGTPGRPILALDSASLPILYAEIRNWCESPDRDNPIFLVYRSGLPTADRPSSGGLTDSLLMMSIPGLNVSAPADEEEAETLLTEADSLTGPSAMLFGNTPAVGLSTVSTVRPGEGRVLREGKDLALVAIGTTVFPCLLAAESLQTVGLSVAVIDLRYRRPLDVKLIESLNRFPILVAVDEHPEAGGIAGHLWRPESAKCRLIRLNIEIETVTAAMDSDLKEELTLEHFGLHAEGIARTVREALRLTPPSTFG